MLDCPIPRRPGMADDVPSVHQFLRDYIGLEKNRLNTSPRVKIASLGRTFSSCQPGVERGRRLVGSDTLFPNYTCCLAYCSQELSEEIGKVRIWKQVLGRDSSHRDSLTLTAKLEPLCLDVSSYLRFGRCVPGLWVDLPMPFRRGDIVWDPSGKQISPL